MHPPEFQLFSVSAFQLFKFEAGIDFLPGITGAKRAEIETFKAAALWAKE